MEDCAKFYECINGKITRLNCSQELVFNEKTHTCDVMKNVPECNYVISDEITKATEKHQISDPDANDNDHESNILNINIEVNEKGNEDDMNNADVTDQNETLDYTGRLKKQQQSKEQGNRFKAVEYKLNENADPGFEEKSFDSFTSDEIKKSKKQSVLQVNNYGPEEDEKTRTDDLKNSVLNSNGKLYVGGWEIKI